MEIKDLQKCADLLQQTGLTPRELSELKQWLSGYFGVISWEIENINGKKQKIWWELYKEHTDTDGKKPAVALIDRLWNATDLGMLESKYESEMKRVEKMSSAISTRLRVMEGEAKNQW